MVVYLTFLTDYATHNFEYHYWHHIILRNLIPCP